MDTPNIIRKYYQKGRIDRESERLQNSEEIRTIYSSSLVGICKGFGGLVFWAWTFEAFGLFSPIKRALRALNTFVCLLVEDVTLLLGILDRLYSLSFLSRLSRTISLKVIDFSIELEAL